MSPPEEYLLQDIEDAYRTYISPAASEKILPESSENKPAVTIVQGLSAERISEGYVEDKEEKKGPVLNITQGACQVDGRDQRKNLPIVPKDIPLIELAADRTQNPPLKCITPTATLRSARFPFYALSEIFPAPSYKLALEQESKEDPGKLEKASEKIREEQIAELHKLALLLKEKLDKIELTEAQKENLKGFDPDIDEAKVIFPELKSKTLEELTLIAEEHFPQLFEKE